MAQVGQVAPKGTQVWAGEAGGAYNSGRQGVTDTFASSFWYLNEMGTAAQLGHQVGVPFLL
eukprot:7875027-Pyramimonas_sp.AAC.1